MAIAGAVGGTMILAAERGVAALPATLVEILALLVLITVWIVAVAKGAAGASASVAGMTFGESGAEARHGCSGGELSVVGSR